MLAVSKIQQKANCKGQYFKNSLTGKNDVEIIYVNLICSHL